MIDVFSRKADAEILKNKGAATVLFGMIRILKRFKFKPNKIQTDKGKEFFNQKFSKFCKDNKIIHFATDTEPKAAVVERFNRTLHTKFATIKRQEPMVKAKDILQKVIWQYNNTPHGHLEGMTPASILIILLRC